MSETRKAELWTCEKGAETFHCRSVQSAVVDFADQVGELPETVTVYGYASKVIEVTDWYAERALENLLESLDEEYWSPDDGTEPTPAMEAAAKAFVAAVVAEYRVWQCDLVETLEVRVADYVRAEAKP